MSELEQRSLGSDSLFTWKYRDRTQLTAEVLLVPGASLPWPVTETHIRAKGLQKLTSHTAKAQEKESWSILIPSGLTHPERFPGTGPGTTGLLCHSGSAEHPRLSSALLLLSPHWPWKRPPLPKHAVFSPEDLRRSALSQRLNNFGGLHRQW